MNENNSDIFEASEKRSLRKKTDNFFLDEGFDNLNLSYSGNSSLRHLNDYDSNILQDGAYKDISDDTFKLEYKITRTEEEIKSLEARLNVAKEIHDYGKVQDLQAKLFMLKNNYKNLLSQYNEKNLAAKITGFVSSIYSNTLGLLIKSITYGIKKLYRIIVSILPAKFATVLRIKESLNTLKNINNSVDNLVSMNIPYDESTDKYQKLSKYIIKANSIQAEISGYLKNNP